MKTRTPNIILPPAWILILGDGQLGMMAAQAAQQAGYRVVVLGPGGPNSPAGKVADRAYAWGADCEVNNELLREVCRDVAVATLEWENVPEALLRRIFTLGIPIRPGIEALRAAQDRFVEKETATMLCIPTTDYRTIASEEDIACVSSTGCAREDSILKALRGGYDGMGQEHVPAGGFIETAWEKLGRVPCILEKKVARLAGEVSVIIARAPYPQTAVLGPFENIHEQGILRTTHYPLKNPALQEHSAEIARQAEQATRRLAGHLEVEGLLAVEFFVVVRDGKVQVLFNEMAPRPHNSGHLTRECFAASQFDLFIAAVCNQPLPEPYPETSGMMQNLLGRDIDGWPVGKKLPGNIFLTRYGKEEVREWRKMAHVVITERLLTNMGS